MFGFGKDKEALNKFRTDEADALVHTAHALYLTCGEHVTRADQFDALAEMFYEHGDFGRGEAYAQQARRALMVAQKFQAEADKVLCEALWALPTVKEPKR